jgi:hypothetical protein
LIPTQPLSEGVVSNEAQTDSGDAWTKDAADAALYDGGSRDGWEIRPQSKNRECQRGGSRRDSDQRALCCDHVNELTGRDLRHQTNQPADRQNSSDTGRRPSVFREMDRGKGTKPRKESSKEEIQPVKRLQAVNRQCGISTDEWSREHRPACHMRTSNELRTEAASRDRLRVTLLHLKLRLITIAPEADIKSVPTKVKIEQTLGPEAIAATAGQYVIFRAAHPA